MGRMKDLFHMSRMGQIEQNFAATRNGACCAGMEAVSEDKTHLVDVVLKFLLKLMCNF